MRPLPFSLCPINNGKPGYFRTRNVMAMTCTLPARKENAAACRSPGRKAGHGACERHSALRRQGRRRPSHWRHPSGPSSKPPRNERNLHPTESGPASASGEATDLLTKHQHPLAPQTQLHLILRAEICCKGYRSESRLHAADHQRESTCRRCLTTLPRGRNATPLRCPSQASRLQASW